MKEITKTYTIPAQERTETVYVAFDGKEFNSKKACEYYEFLEGMYNNFVYKTAISSCEFHNNEIGTLFYFRNEEDYNFLLESKGLKKNYGCGYYLTANFNVFGPGWYLYYYEDGGDGADSYYILNYQYYLKELKKDLKKYEEDNYAKMMEKMAFIKGEIDNEKS